MTRINPHTNINNEIALSLSAAKTSAEMNTIFSKNALKQENTEIQGITLEKEKVSPKGSTNPEHLKNAPEPIITIAGEKKFAAIVIDTKTNLLYKYNDKGQAEIVYSVATGKKSTPTRKGIKMIGYWNSYPVKFLPKNEFSR